MRQAGSAERAWIERGAAKSATETTRFLPRPIWRLVWQAIRTSACYEQTQGMWTAPCCEFLEALAMRDREAIVSRTGRTLLAEGTYACSESMQARC